MMDLDWLQEILKEQFKSFPWIEKYKHNFEYMIRQLK